MQLRPENFAGPGYPPQPGSRDGPSERIVDCGSGARADSLIAAKIVGPDRRVIGVDLTLERISKARRNALETGMVNVKFSRGNLESLPVPDAWADVVSPPIVPFALIWLRQTRFRRGRMADNP